MELSGYTATVEQFGPEVDGHADQAAARWQLAHRSRRVSSRDGRGAPGASRVVSSVSRPTVAALDVPRSLNSSKNTTRTTAAIAAGMSQI